jgi:hypothetical protein
MVSKGTREIALILVAFVRDTHNSDCNIDE